MSPHHMAAQYRPFIALSVCDNISVSWTRLGYPHITNMRTGPNDYVTHPKSEFTNSRDLQM